jgi:hypothetical protein
LADDGLPRAELSRVAVRRLPRSTRVLWPVAAGMAAAAASTLTTAGAAAAAGRQADLALQPVELALRVGLLLVAPCAGALLAAVVIPRGGGRPAVAAIGLGVPVGPLLVLRLDRMDEFGPVPIALTVAVLVLWGVAGALLAAGWWRRPDRAVERTDLPAAAPGGGAEAADPGPEAPGPSPTETSHPPRAG